MMRGLAIALALLASGPCAAAELDDAVALVLAAHPVLIAERGQLEAASRQHDWKTDVTLSWTRRGTDYGGVSGANAGIRLSIPLFDRSRELRMAKARAAESQAEEQVRDAFLADVATLRATAANVRELETLRDLQRDQLQYRRKRVEQGLANADTLWPEAEKMQKADNDYRRELEALDAALDTMARKYGGDEWKRLRDLLAGLTKPGRR